MQKSCYDSGLCSVFVCEVFGEMCYPNLQSFVLRRQPCWRPTKEHVQIWQPKTNRNIAIKRVLISRQLINIKLNTYSKNKDCSDKKNLKKRCHSLTYSYVTAFAAPLLSRHAIFNNYSPKAKLILLNNPQDEVEGIIQQY